jgi:U4/U6.U5 tri-snRNP component SNU23
MSKGVINVHRKTWDTAAYARMALEREDKERSAGAAAAAADDDTVETSFGKFKFAEVGAAGPAGSTRAYLDVTAARAHLDIDSRVGKVLKVEGGARKAGYDCVLCDLVFHDSASLLDHLNSKLHQSKLGFSMKTERSTTEQVKSRLAQLSEEALSRRVVVVEEEDSLETRIAKAKAEEEARKQAKKDKKKAKKQKRLVVTAAEEEEEED